MHLRTHRQRAIAKQEWRHREKRWPFRPAALDKAIREWHSEWDAYVCANVDPEELNEEHRELEALERGYTQDRI